MEFGESQRPGIRREPVRIVDDAIESSLDLLHNLEDVLLVTFAK